LVATLPTLFDTQGGAQIEIDRFFQQQGIPLSVASLGKQIAIYVTSAGSSLLGGTLAVLTA